MSNQSPQDAMPVKTIWRLLTRAQSHVIEMRGKEKGTFERLKFAIFAQINTAKAAGAPNIPEENAKDAKKLISETTQAIDEDENLEENIEKLIEEANKTIKIAEEILEVSNASKKPIQAVNNLILEAPWVMDEDKNQEINTERLIEITPHVREDARAVIKKAESIRKAYHQTST